MTEYTVVLPCRLGDAVYYINGDKRFYITVHEVKGFRINEKGLQLDLNGFQLYYPNERLFFSRKAAIEDLYRRLTNENIRY